MHQHTSAGNKLKRNIIFWMPVALFFAFAFLKTFHVQLYLNLIQEDTLLEHLQVIFYFLSFVVGAVVTFRFFKQKNYLPGITYLLFALAMFFISLEEFSWGQRIFDIENPEYFEQNNDQNELTLHNLKPVMGIISEAYIVLGFFGTFGWYFVSKLPKGKVKEFLKIIIPGKHLMFYFFFTFLVYAMLEWLLPLFEYEFGWSSLARGNFFIWRDQEPAELILSLGFLFFTISTLKKQGRLANHNAHLFKQLSH